MNISTGQRKITAELEELQLEIELESMTTERKRLITRFGKSGGSCSADTFVGNQHWFSASTFVVENRHLRQARKRCRQG
jgi:hypothetical protein